MKNAFYAREVPPSHAASYTCDCRRSAATERHKKSKFAILRKPLERAPGTFIECVNSPFLICVQRTVALASDAGDILPMGGTARIRLPFHRIAVAGQLRPQVVLFVGFVIHGIGIGHAEAVSDARRIDGRSDSHEHRRIGTIDASREGRHHRDETYDTNSSRLHAILRLLACHNPSLPQIDVEGCAKLGLDGGTSPPTRKRRSYMGFLGIGGSVQKT